MYFGVKVNVCCSDSNTIKMQTIMFSRFSRVYRYMYFYGPMFV